MFRKAKGTPYYKNRHSCFLLQYHMVLVTKYRHPVLQGDVKNVVYNTIKTILDEKGFPQIRLHRRGNLQTSSRPKRQGLSESSMAIRFLSRITGNRTSGLTVTLWRQSASRVLLLSGHTYRISKTAVLYHVRYYRRIHPHPCGAVAPMDGVLCARS